MSAQIISLAAHRAQLDPEETLLRALPKTPCADLVVARVVEDARRSLVWLLKDGYTSEQAADALKYASLYAPLYQAYGEGAYLPALKEAAEQVAAALAQGERTA